MIDASATAAAGKRARTRVALLDATLAIIAEHGPQAACIDAVVRRAGMARGTFYNYFASVPALLDAATAALRERTEASIAPWIDPAWNSPTTLACVLRAFLQVCIEDPTLGRAWSHLSCEIDWLDDRRDSEASRRWRHALAELVAQPTRRVAATALLSGTTMMTLRLALDGRLSNEDLAGTLAMALRGLGARAAQVDSAIRRASALASAIVARAREDRGSDARPVRH